jgi:hypothetical protein
MKLKLTLLSDATLGRGDGVAGLVDAEVEHDAYGMPYLRGRTLKGLLAEEAANIIFSLEQFAAPDQIVRWKTAAEYLFGLPGSTLETNADLHVSDARLPEDLRKAVIADLSSSKYEATDVLESLTAIRRQTAMDESGVPEKETLRAIRVILRDTFFEADLDFARQPTDDALAFLAACVKALRRVGTGRNRGRGRTLVSLIEDGQDVTQDHFARFREEVGR